LLALQLSALQEEGKLNILSSPSITTLDNQSALIESGAEVPFQTVEDDEVSIEFKEAKLKLEVTPHVIDNHWLKMKIVTNKDELDFSRTVQGNPTIITRKAQTNVLLFDGQTTVIGGLNQQSDSDTKTGVPVLSDIPLLGSLGKRTNKSKKMVDVLIFITPHILKQKPVNVPAGESRKGNPS
jgi:type IV pilus assembly protein PilQ